MDSKLILVTYLERNKIVKIPNMNHTHDLKHLELQVRKEFKLATSELIFQRFDTEWGDFVDLDEEETLGQRDKVKVVVPLVSMLSSLTSSDNLKVIAETSDSMSEPESPSGSYSSSDTVLFSNSEQQEDVIAAKFDNNSSEPVTKKPKFIKTEDDSIPLPDPFPLPKHYRGDIEKNLKDGKMTKETMAAFLSAIASAMLVFKRYPTKDDYICVARSVVKCYPFMSSPVGTPHGAVVTSLMNRFKEFRRTPAVRAKSVGPKKSPRKKRPGITQSPSQPILTPGEDGTSLKRHARVLQVEFKKTRRNEKVVSDLMTRTFPMRRKAIMENAYSLETIFQQFPFLQESDQLMAELERIIKVEGLKMETRTKWGQIAPKIVSQAQLEASSRVVVSALEEMKIFEGNMELASLVVLPALLPDPHYKVDLNRVIYLALGSSDVKAVVSGNQKLEPYILIIGEDTESIEAYLVVDKQVIDEVSFIDIPFVLMAAFFVYNICYPKGCNNFYSFLEIVTLRYSPEKASTSVKYLLTRISSH